MSPEYGSTCAIFPIDDETLSYLRLTGRPAPTVALVEAYAKRAGPVARPVGRTALLRAGRAGPVDRRAVAGRSQAAAGPGPAHRRQGDVPHGAGRLRDGHRAGAAAAHPWGAAGSGGGRQRQRRRRGQRRVLPGFGPGCLRATSPRTRPRSPHNGAGDAEHDRPRNPVAATLDGGESVELDHGARRDRRDHQLHQHLEPLRHGRRPGCSPRPPSSKGLSVQPWVKTTLAPGSKVVTDYYERAGLDPLPRQARLRDRRLRLHHLHRQLRAAARRRSVRPSTRVTSRWCRCCRATATSRGGSTRTSR